MNQVAGIFLAATLLLASGCSSPDPAFYTLQAVPGRTLPVSARIIEVRRPGLAGYLDRSDIVMKSNAYRLDLNTGTRWAEPLGDMIGRVLTQNISQRLPGSSVFAESGAISADPQLRVEVEVQRFDADESGVVRLVGELALETGRGHQLVQTRSLSLEARPEGSGPAALAAAMSVLLGQVADQAAVQVAAARL